MNAVIKNNKLIDNLVSKIPAAMATLAIENELVKQNPLKLVSMCIGTSFFCVDAKLKGNINITSENKELWSAENEKITNYYINKRGDIAITVKFERLKHAAHTTISGTIVHIEFSSPSENTEDNVPGVSKGEAMKSKYTDRKVKQHETSHSQATTSKRKRKLPGDVFNSVMIPDDKCLVSGFADMARRIFQSFKTAWEDIKYGAAEFYNGQ